MARIVRGIAAESNQWQPGTGSCRVSGCTEISVARQFEIGRTSVRRILNTKRACMTTKKNDVPQAVYQVKVTLLGTRPSIWRRLLVPAELTLAQLHNILQAAIGWQNCHLHEFRISG